jgi:hypothetical protein
MANSLDENLPGDWMIDLTRRIERLEKRTSLIPVGHFLIKDDGVNLVVVNTRTGVTTVIA